jgi:hypothetical protein
MAGHTQSASALRRRNLAAGNNRRQRATRRKEGPSVGKKHHVFNLMVWAERQYEAAIWPATFHRRKAKDLLTHGNKKAHFQAREDGVV